MPAPAQPKIYHITHIENFASIVADGCLWPDASMIQRQSGTIIGVGRIKRRRLGLPVKCHHGLNVGDCVPFYFCPRSIMLFKIHRADDPELPRQDGQEPIIHLEADMHRTVRWAEANGRCWAFSTINAASAAAEFHDSLDAFGKINWAAVNARFWTTCRDEKQAEFLAQGFLPWYLIERIGVRSRGMVSRVANAMQGAPHRPKIEIKPDWYY